MALSIPNPSYSRLVIPIPAKSLTNRNISKETMCAMSFAFTDYESQKQDELNTSIRISVTIASRTE